jgi:uncharacterized protein YndB with AHSA1/START domain
MSGKKLKSTVTVRVSQEEVFAAFTEPAHLSRWFTTDARADLRVGGRYSNGDNDKGKFLEIDPPRRVRFTWENEMHCPGTMVDVEFNVTDDREVAIRLEHSQLSSEKDVRDMETGWSWALESLKSYLETGRAIPFEGWQKNRREKD